MISGLLGKKVGMTQVFTEGGAVVPVTVIEAGPCHVMQVKSPETDGYHAVQLGFEDRKRKNATKPECGHAREAKTEPKRFVREIRSSEPVEVERGQVVTVAVFDGVGRVTVTGTSKGKGFQGVIRRHGFHGLGASHGVSKVHRSPGSIGQASDPSRVFKGVRMPGQMGHVRRTVQNLEVVRVDAERNLLLVKGAVPGHNGSYLVVKAQAARRGKTQ